MEPIETKRTVFNYNQGAWSKREDTVVTEFALTIKLNQKEFATMVCTPEYMEDLVVGFLASEHVISRASDVTNLWIDRSRGFAHVTVNQTNDLYDRFHSKRYITSCCGMSRQGFYFVNDAMTAKRMHDNRISFTPEQCISLMQIMQSQADTFQRTGGVHNAALCDENGVVISRIDIGRHNALDKIYGYCLKHDISLENKALVFSGRISSEIVIKTSKIGCAVLLSKSAPTELALQLADQLGVTTVGFIRNQSFNVYTHPERIVSCQEDQPSAEESNNT
jgi:FdhD protein